MDFSMQTGIAIFTLCLVAVVSTKNTALEEAVHEDIHLNTTELINKYGYKAETHKVNTADEYILEMHRITGEGPPVFLQHGLLCSSADWVVMGPGKSLAYILADEGYDVWMGNARGNTYSRKHETRTPSDKDFWDFSWHEMGIYDLPAEIDYVLENTKKEQLYYIGHSMGTTMFYVMASELPAYNKKIRAMFSLAPMAHMSHLNNPFAQILSRIEELAPKLVSSTHLVDIITEADRKLCNDIAVTQSLCNNQLFLIAGYDSKDLNMTMIPVILGHVPQETSIKTFLHYGQEVASGKFCQYDLGMINNKELYGAYKPPDYDVSRITAPVALHYSQDDWLSSKTDVSILGNELPNLIGRFLVGDRNFNHLDYLYANHANEEVYKKVLYLMKCY